MVSVTAVQIGSVGNLAQTETSVGQAVKSKKDDFETEVLSLGKSDAIRSFAGKIAQSLGSSLPTELLNGTTSIQSVLSKLNEYFLSNGLNSLSKETTARLGVLNISDPTDYVMNLSTGLGTLKDSIRSSFANTLSIDSLSNARESVSSAINSFDIGNLTSVLSGGSTTLASAQDIASSIGNGYTSSNASAKNVGNISAVEEKGIDKILKKLGEEATEIVIAAKNPNPNEVKYEISDFLYHMMVLMAEKNVTWEEITTELANR